MKYNLILVKINMQSAICHLLVAYIAKMRPYDVL